jgi:hypothetical protein
MMTKKETRIAIVKALLVALMLVGRGVWMSYPTLAACLAFWAVALTWDTLGLANATARHGRIAWLSVSVGGALNAVVTIANNGRMPCIGYPLTSDQTSVWVTAIESHRLLFLADNAAFYGCSIGDLLLFVGALLAALVWVMPHIAARLAQTLNAPERDAET